MLVTRAVDSMDNTLYPEVCYITHRVRARWGGGGVGPGWGGGGVRSRWGGGGVRAR